MATSTGCTSTGGAVIFRAAWPMSRLRLLAVLHEQVRALFEQESWQLFDVRPTLPDSKRGRRQSLEIIRLQIGGAPGERFDCIKELVGDVARGHSRNLFQREPALS